MHSHLNKVSFLFSCVLFCVIICVLSVCLCMCCSPPWPRSVWASSWCCCSPSPNWPTGSWCHDRPQPVPILMPGTCPLADDWLTSWFRKHPHHLSALLLLQAAPALLCGIDPSSVSCRRGIEGAVVSLWKCGGENTSWSLGRQSNG